MFCKRCGKAMRRDSELCSACGAGPSWRSTKRGGIGYSINIHDPAFSRYIKNSKRWAMYFAFGLSIAAVVGFFIYGEVSSEIDNPEALYIGLGIGGMFLTIAALQVIFRNRSRTWDGVVVDRTVTGKSRTRNSDDDGYTEYYTEYAVTVREDRTGKTHQLTAEDDDTRYNYFKVGDRVRHHAGLNSYEKYDKSQDGILFCNACASLCDIEDECCFRCGCPLLK